jgi:hypothetical protein
MSLRVFAAKNPLRKSTRSGDAADVSAMAGKGSDERVLALAPPQAVISAGAAVAAASKRLRRLMCMMSPGVFSG